jgi:hypothetical protein
MITTANAPSAGCIWYPSIVVNRESLVRDKRQGFFVLSALAARGQSGNI